MAGDRPHDSVLPILAGQVEYDPATGKFRWLYRADFSRAWNSRRAGKEAGSLHKRSGYFRVSFTLEGRKYFVAAHRLAWFMATGTLPRFQIDHINQDKTDNRICNLRDVPQSLNARNAPLHGRNSSGICGVVSMKGKWQARVNVDRKAHYLGVFESKSDAAKAAEEFRSANGFTNSHGKIEYAGRTRR